MSLSNEQVLIDYLDNTLKGEERRNAERLIQDDAAAAEELQHLQFSVDIIREAALFEQVVAVRKEYNSGAMVSSIKKNETGAVVRSLYKNAFRIAAMVLLLLGAGAVYEYSATNSSGVFNKYYTSFDLNTSRGNNNDGDIEKAYRNKDWTTVNNIFITQKVKNGKTWFLNGMADMELKNYDKAIFSFSQVMNLNKNVADSYYQDEAEYYLAMSYIAAKKPSEGVTLLKKIRSDKNHLFNQRALEMSSIDLKVLEMKGDK